MIGGVLGDRYELLGLLAETPIFASYSARDLQTRRDVCVRIVQDPFRAQGSLYLALSQAVKAQQGINSPQVETITQIEQDGDTSYLVSDLTRSPTIADRIRKLAPFSTAVAVSTIISICKAVETVHRSAVVHGDLNPQNILVMGDGEAKLQLPGIWEAYSASPTAGMSVLPAMAPYLAPEVTQGAMPSRLSDIYAIGVLLYELLTARKPFHADTALAVASAHVSFPTPTVRALNPSVPVVLDEIVKKAMSKDPSDRYQSCTEMLADLRILQDALRFGKSLSWPLTTTVATTPKKQTSGAKQQAGNKQQGVAPRMSALRTDEDAEQSRRKAREDRDVPLWLTIAASVFFVGLLAAIGAFVMLNLSKPKLVAVPNIRDMSVEEAKSALKPLKLDLKIVRREPNEKIEQDKVLEMDPSAGEKMREGERVRVVVSSGTRKVIVPDVKGQTVDKAKQVLAVLNIEPLIQVSGGGEAKSDSVVLKTDPPARTQIDRFGRIILVIGDPSLLNAPDPDAPKKPVEDEVLPPDENKKAEEKPDEAKNGKFSITVKVDSPNPEVKVTVDMTDDDGTETIFDETQKAGDKITVSSKSKSSKVTFQVYFDGDLVKTQVVEAKK